MAKKIEVVIAGDASKLESELKKAGTEVTGFADKTGRGSKKLDALKTAAKGAVVGGIGVLVGGLKSSVSAAVDAEAAQAKVEQMVKNAGISYRKHGDEIDRVIQKQSRMSGFDDEELAESFANMVRTTGSLTKSYELNNTVMDLARSKGMGLQQAQSLLARVYNGNYNGLKKLGIRYQATSTHVDKLKASNDKYTPAQLKAAQAADEAENRQRALGLVQEKFGGQAEAFGKTAAGGQERFKVAVENLQESIGAGLLPMLTALANKVTNVVIWLEKNKGVAIALGVVVGALGGAIAAVAIAQRTSAAFTAVATGAQWAWNAAMSANPIGLVVLAIAALVGGLIVAYTKVDWFRNAVDTAFAVVVGAGTAVVDFIKGNWQTILTVIAGPFAPLVLIATNFGKVKSAIGDVVGAVGGFVRDAKEKIGSIATTIGDLPGKLAAQAGEWAKAGKGLGGDLLDGIAKGLGASAGWVSNIGDKLLSALKGAWNSVVRSINDKLDFKIKGPGPLPDIHFNAPDIPQLAEGGVVTRPTLVMAGEAGPEAIIPLSKTRGGLGGIVQNFYGPIGSTRAARVMGDQLAYSLKFGTQ